MGFLESRRTRIFSIWVIWLFVDPETWRSKKSVDVKVSSLPGSGALLFDVVENAHKGFAFLSVTHLGAGFFHFLTHDATNFSFLGIRQFAHAPLDIHTPFFALFLGRGWAIVALGACVTAAGPLAHVVGVKALSIESKLDDFTSSYSDIGKGIFGDVFPIGRNLDEFPTLSVGLGRDQMTLLGLIVSKGDDRFFSDTGESCQSQGFG